MKRCFGKSTQGAMLALVCFLVATAAPARAEVWKFGVMSDTQWPTSPDNKNPNVAVNVVNHLNQQFIAHGVKFVVQTGDITDGGGNAQLDIRATFAQALYNAGIGYYPLRGNHESSKAAAIEFQRIFPQTGAVAANAGKNNSTPSNAMSATTFYGAAPTVLGSVFTVGSNFQTESTMEGLTYSFDYNNARFVFIDQFTKPSGTSHSVLDSTDVSWIGGRLSSLPANTHAFVFGHKGLITENHSDNLFGSDPTANATLTNTFMSALANAGVRYYMGGHDHMHNRAIVASPNGSSRVQNIINASDSYKFYIPGSGGSWNSRETMVAQELFAIGYYIVTVDGPRVTVDYYASPNGCNGDCDETTDVIPYTFTKRESFGYSLNGQETVVAQKAAYNITDDTSKAVGLGEAGYIGTTASIFDGANGSTGKDYRNRALSKTVDTGWSPRTSGTISDIVTIWGMSDSLGTKLSPYSYVLGSDETDKYVITMDYDPSLVTPQQIQSGLFGIASKDAEGNWINATSKNYNGTEYFVSGPHMMGDPVGYFGVDPDANTAWAVVDHQGDFSVADFSNGNPSLYALVSAKAGPASARVWTLKLVNGPESVTGARIDDFSLVQTAGAACAPVLRSTNYFPASFPISIGNIGAGETALNDIQVDFSSCAANARFKATIDYSAGAVSGSKTLYNQLR